MHLRTVYGTRRRQYNTIATKPPISNVAIEVKKERWKKRKFLQFHTPSNSNPHLMGTKEKKRPHTRSKKSNQKIRNRLNELS